MRPLATPRGHVVAPQEQCGSHTTTLGERMATTTHPLTEPFLCAKPWARVFLLTGRSLSPMPVVIAQPTLAFF